MIPRLDSLVAALGAACPVLRIAKVTAPALTTVQLCQPDGRRCTLLLSEEIPDQPLVGPTAHPDVDGGFMLPGTASSVEVPGNPLTLTVDQHGGLVTGPLYLYGSTNGVTVTVIEIGFVAGEVHA